MDGGVYGPWPEHSSPSQRAVKRCFSEPGWIPGRCATLREIWVRIMKDGLNARGEINGGGAGGCTGPRLLVDTAIFLMEGGNKRPFVKLQTQLIKCQFG